MSQTWLVTYRALCGADIWKTNVQPIGEDDRCNLMSVMCQPDLHKTHCYRFVPVLIKLFLTIKTNIMLHFQSFKDLDAIIEVAVKLELPKDLNFYGTETTFRHTHNFLKNLGSSGVCHINLNKDGKYPVFADVLSYGGYRFNLIYVDKIIDQSVSEVSCYHDWELQKTTFSDKPIDINNPPPFEELAEDGVVLSRYCKSCGVCQTYHGQEKKWIETGSGYK